MLPGSPLPFRHDLLHRCSAHATPRLVHDPAERHLVVPVCQEGKIGKRVLYLLPRVESDRPDQPEGDVVLTEACLEMKRLRVHPVQDRGGAGEIVRGDSRAELRFLLLVLETRHHGSLSRRPFGPEGLAEPPLVVAHHGARQVQDAGGGAVVAFQAHDLGARENVGEGKDVADLGSPKPVDRLVVVAHHAEIGLRLPQLLQQLELRHVRVLVLVHQDDAETLTGALPDLGHVPEQLERAQDEIAEVDVSRLPERLLVRKEDLGIAAGALDPFPWRGRADSQVLDPADLVVCPPEVTAVFVLSQERLEERKGVVLVVDAETGIEARMGGIAAEEPCPEGMEGPHHDVPGTWHDGEHTLLHLLRRLVGEGNGEYGARAHSHPVDQPCDLCRDHARLARIRRPQG